LKKVILVILETSFTRVLMKVRELQDWHSKREITKSDLKFLLREKKAPELILK